MAQKVFLHETPPSSRYSWSSGNNDANLVGTAQGWTSRFLDTLQGASAKTLTRSTTAGPTAGQEVPSDGLWITAPLSADFTIAGTITFNIRGFESGMGVNAGWQVVVERVGSDGTILSTIVNSEFGTEMGTSETAGNWTAVPTSTACKRGDRLRVRIAVNDVGTLAAGTVSLKYDGAAGATGDTWVQFTENLTFAGAPLGTTLFLTDSASQVDPNGASYDAKEMWTAIGAGDVTVSTTLVAGWTAPLLAKVNDVNFIEWFSRPVAGFTLAGPVEASLDASEEVATDTVAVRGEIAVCDSDGTLVVVWGATSSPSDLATAVGAVTFVVAGEQRSVTDGQRFRFRVYFDDIQSAAMGVATDFANLRYAETGGTRSKLLFTETLTEFIPTGRPQPAAVLSQAAQTAARL